MLVNSSKKNNYLPIMLLIFFEAVFLKFILMPDLSRYSELKSELIASRKNIEKSAVMIEELKSMDVKDTAGYFFQSDADFSALIRDLIQKNNLTLVTKTFNKNIYTSDITGRQSDIFSFINDIDFSKKAFFIKQMILSPYTDKVSLRIVMNYYTKSQAKVKAKIIK